VLLIDALNIFEQVTNPFNNLSENEILLILKEISKIHQGEKVDLKSFFYQIFFSKNMHP